MHPFLYCTLGDLTDKGLLSAVTGLWGIIHDSPKSLSSFPILDSSTSEDLDFLGASRKKMLFKKKTEM